MNKTVGLITMEKFDNRIFNSVGSSRIRMRWMLPYWDEAEEYIIGKKYDVLVFQKVYWKSFFDHAQDYKGITIFDICDPDWLENKPVFEFIDKVDAVTTSTQPLADFIKKIRPNANVRCIPDRVFMPEATPVKTEHSEELKKVVWFGYSQNSHYLARCYPDLIERGIELVVVSDSPIDASLMYRNKLQIQNVPYNYATLNKELIKYDAVLMPDPFGDERAKYKSNNKTLQAWSIGMPVIKLPEDFERLKTKEARVKESEEKLQEIKNKWDVKYSVEEYKALIKEITDKRNVQ